MSHTRESLTEDLTAYGAVPVFEGDARESFGNKTRIKFTCGCGELSEKAIRDFERSGAYCKDCGKANKSALISQARSMPPQVITDPETEQICSQCKWLKPKSEFTHAQNSLIPSVRCLSCRTTSQKKDARGRERGKKREVPEEISETHQKCTKCFRVKEISQFTSTNGNCKGCNKHSRTQYKKAREKAENHNTNDEGDTIMCVRCWCVKDTANFVTDKGHIGVVCPKCRGEIALYKSKFNDAYLDIKKSKGPCVDCGESDIRVLEFDHIDRTTKERGITECRSISQLMEEAPKCEIRCVICHIRRTKEQLNIRGSWGRESRKEYVDNKKIEIGGCESCGWFDKTLLEALHFDHLDENDKDVDISFMVAKFYPIEEINDEIMKCQLYCANCHKRRTLQQFGSTLYNDQ